MYEALVRETRSKVSQLTLEQQKEIVKIYDDAIKGMAKEIEKGFYEGDEDYIVYTVMYQKELEKSRDKLVKELNGQIKDSIEKAAKHGTRPEEKIMEDIFNVAGIEIGEDFKSMFGQVQENVVRDIIGGGLYKDKRTLDERIWNYGKEYERDIQYIINQGILEKKGPIELAKDLEQFVKEPAKRPWDWGNIYPKIMSKKVDYNAMRLARTSINHAYQTATIQASNLNPFIEGIEWQAALIHGRTCEVCKERHGQIFKKDKVPLDHPNGICTMLPVIEGTLEDVGKRLRDWLEGEEDYDLEEWYNEYRGYLGSLSKRRDEKISKKVGEKRYSSTKEAFKKVSYRNIDKEYAKEIDNRLLELQNRYPINEGNIEVKALAKRNLFGYSQGQIVQKGKNTLIYRDEIVFSNVTMRDKEISKKLHDAEYKDRGSKLRNDLASVDHEYAHAIDNYYVMIIDKKIRETADEYRKGIPFRGTWDHINEVNDFNRSIVYHDEKMSNVVYDKMKIELGISDSEMNRLIRKELGSYAASSKAEFLAEGFANMGHLKEEEKTDFIRLFEKIFNDEFDEVIRGWK